MWHETESQVNGKQGSLIDVVTGMTLVSKCSPASLGFELPEVDLESGPSTLIFFQRSLNGNRSELGLVTHFYGYWFPRIHKGALEPLWKAYEEIEICNARIPDEKKTW